MKNTIGYMRLRIASISKLAAATTLSLGLIACGGEREQQAPQDNEARVTVQGADGASVSYARSTGDHAKITVRVARDASGAQPLPQDLKPLSSIYQFTPLGMAATDIEIRLPFSASATDRGAPSLWVTVPGEGWTQLLDARVEGSWMVARAPRMAHAVVATSPLQSSSFKPSSPSATLASIHHILAKESFTATTTGPGQLGAPWMWAASPGGTLTFPGLRKRIRFGRGGADTYWLEGYVDHGGVCDEALFVGGTELDPGVAKYCEVDESQTTSAPPPTPTGSQPFPATFVGPGGSGAWQWAANPGGTMSFTGLRKKIRYGRGGATTHWLEGYVDHGGICDDTLFIGGAQLDPGATKYCEVDESATTSVPPPSPTGSQPFPGTLTGPGGDAAWQWVANPGGTVSFAGLRKKLRYGRGGATTSWIEGFVDNGGVCDDTLFVGGSQLDPGAPKYCEVNETFTGPIGSTTQPSLSINIDPATSPPVVQAGTSAQVTQQTNLRLSAPYVLNACAGDLWLSIEASFVSAAGNASTVPLASRLVSNSALQGSLIVDRTLTANDNGTWQFVARAACTAGYSVMATGPAPSLQVNISAASTAPAITQSPVDVSALAGGSATFSVSASGSELLYQWQRSSDGGLSFQDVAGQGPSITVPATTLADNGSLWRVVVSNGAGASTSGAARLTVVAAATPPAIVSDPFHQTVLVGQTASFTVAASGSPTPTIQWQWLPAGASPTQWSDVAGANAQTYTTAPATLADSGNQYRTVIQNTAGLATSLPATLTVSTSTVAPGISSQPQAQSVQAGQYGLFGVAATGTSPLSYQWFKNGQPIFGANATEVLVLAEAGDIGGSYQISVEVSNSAGRVVSASVAMSVLAVPAGGVLIKAAEGGSITVVTGAEVEPMLIVPPGSLASDTMISVFAQSGSVANLPPEIVALGDVINIGPAVSFIEDATLYLPVPDAVPEGKVLAVIELDGPVPQGKSNATAKRDSSGNASNLKRLSTSSGKRTGVTLMATGDPLRIMCPSPQAIRGRSVLVDLARSAVRFVMAAVPEVQCGGDTTRKVRARIPETTTAPCNIAQFPALDSGINQVSRHVHCQVGRSDEVRLGYTPPNQPSKDFGRFRMDWRIGSDGPAKDLNKTYRITLRLTPLDPGPDALSGLTVLPVFSCGADPSQGLCSAALRAPAALPAGVDVEIETLVNFSWDGGSGTYKEITPSQIQLKMSFPGEVGVERNLFLSQPPTIRCDKQMSVNGGEGCVYAQAPAVLVQALGDSTIKEAAEHIRDAQAGGSRGGLTINFGDYFAAPSNALSRAASDAVRDANRNAACELATSLRYTRPATQSASCKASNNSGCQCDEYPYAKTWNGASFDPSGTSVRLINGGQNGKGGNQYQQFLHHERVLDFTPPNGSALGESFWVHVE